MQDADAQDLAQHVLMAVAAAINRWEDRGDGIRFRHWLRRVASNAIINALTRGPEDAGIGGSSIQELLKEHSQPDQATIQQIEVEYRRELYLQAAETVKADVLPETWQAFELSVVHGHSIDETALAIGKSAGTVYAARSRIMRRLKDAVKEAEEALN